MRTTRSIEAALVAFAAILVYANSLWNGYALDDVYIVQANARVHDLANQAAIWLRPYWPNYGRELGLYRPMAIFGYAVQWAIAGGAPWIFHLTNVLLHVAASVLVYALLRTLLRHPTPEDLSYESTAPGARYAALFGALLFAVHPVHAEVVANIVGQAELIAGVTTLAACVLYARRPTAGPRPALTAVIAVSFAVALLTKESAIVLPALLVLLDVVQRRVRWNAASLRAYARAFAPVLLVLVVLTAAYFALRMHVIGSIGGSHAAPNMPFLREENRIFVAFRAWPEYVRLLFFPTDLSSDYSPAVILPIEGLTPMAGLGLLLLLATVALAALTFWFPLIGFPAAWFFITILPTSNLLLPIGVVVAERLLYTPSLAVAFIGAAVWRVVADARLARPWVPVALALAFLAAGAVRTVLRNSDWKDTSAVWDALVRDHPESYRSQVINAARVYEQGNRDLAREYLELAVRLWGYDAPTLTMLGQHLLEDREFERAEELIGRAREIAPYVRGMDETYAYALLSLGRARDALAVLDRDSTNATAGRTILALRAQAFQRLGRFDDALRIWEKARTASGPDLWAYRLFHVRARAQAGDSERALALLDSAANLAQQPAEHAEVDSLRAAIGRNCYDAVPATPSQAPHADASSCDPLRDWPVVGPFVRQAFARILQDARQ